MLALSVRLCVRPCVRPCIRVSPTGFLSTSSLSEFHRGRRLNMMKFIRHEGSRSTRMQCTEHTLENKNTRNEIKILKTENNDS